MAYVLVAIGAVMAVAGLYVIGYGWIDVRYEEYWHALSAGATLTAGGLITLALGFAIRALLQVRAALVAQPVAVASIEVPAVAAVAASQVPPDLQMPVASRGVESTTSEPQPFDATPETHEAPPETQLLRDLPTAPPIIARERHPLRPPSVLQDHEPVAPVAVDIAEVDHIDRVQTEVEPSVEPAAAPLLATRHGDGHDLQHVEPDHHDVGFTHPEDLPAARPADDYKLAMPAADQDFPKAAETTAQPVAPKTLPKAHDWFDRALADIDEELPLHAPSARSPIAPAPSRDEVAAEPAHEPAAVGAEPALLDAHDEAPAIAPPTAPSSAVIGRYEAEGTSYVMYADGSIEAQSSAGVYRFGSMSELKAFIES